MARSERLLDLLQAVRRHRRPVSGARLAEELGVSLRTIYRDMRSLAAQGAPIDGEAGVGYVLGPGYTLPPLMFTDEEIEAVALGSSKVAASADAPLARAARDALAKIAAVLPEEKRESVQTASLLSGPRRPAACRGSRAASRLRSREGTRAG
jgi:predicted DNA-binding transcriptional regulator YafY